MRYSLLVFAASVVALPLAAHADLLGDSVNVVVAYPTATTTFDNLGNYTVPSAGADAGAASFVINPTQIFVTAQIGETFNPASFNGLEFTDVTRDPGILSVTADPASSFSGETVTFNSKQVFLNLQGLTVIAGDTLVLDLGFAPTSSVTPEPSSIALLGTGLLGVAGTMRRRFVRS